MGAKLLKMSNLRRCAVLGTLLAAAAAHAQSRDPWAEARTRMVEYEVVAAGREGPSGLRRDPQHAAARVRSRRHAAVRLFRHRHAHRRRPDHLVAVHRGLHDRATAAAAHRQGPGDRHRQRIPGRRAQWAGGGSLLDRDRRNRSASARRRRSAGWATRTSRRRSATAIKAGPNTRRSTRSSSPARRRTFPSRSWSNSRRAAGWWFPWGSATSRALYLFKKVKGVLQAEPLQPTFFVPMMGRAEEERAVQADSGEPVLVNGDFKNASGDQPVGWYYVRQGKVEAAGRTPGGNCLSFRNDTPGRAAQALQAVGIDGRRTQEIEISLWVRGRQVQPGSLPEQHPSLDGRLLQRQSRSRFPGMRSGRGPAASTGSRSTSASKCPRRPAWPVWR